MLVLATDTSGQYGSVALVRCEAGTASPLELVPLQGGTFSAQLIPQIAELLSKHNLGKTDIDAFAVATGPGSFTGLRVGLAAIKALAEILQKPIAPVSLLEVIAFEAGKDERGSAILAAMDAGRNQAFVGEYKVGPELPSEISESLLSLQELAEEMSHSPTPIYTPDDNIAQALSFRDGDSGSPNVRLLRRPNAVSIAHLGWKKVQAGQTLSPEALDATYIRRADAEITKLNRLA